MTLPVPVNRNRFLAPECVFIFGICRSTSLDPPGGGPVSSRRGLPRRVLLVLLV
jgi:hypothetical protein